MRTAWAPMSLLLAADLSLAQETRPVAGADVPILGSVVRADRSPVTGATVTLESRGRAPVVVATDEGGRFFLVLSRTDTSAFVAVRMIGYGTQRRGVRCSDAVGGVITFEFVMAALVTRLNAQKIVAERARPIRDMTGKTATPGATQLTIDRGSGLSGDLSGDLTSSLGMIPGVTNLPRIRD